MHKIYNIQNKEVSDNAVAYRLHLDANNPIYKAHFPSEPITPGVCIVQIAKELLEDHVGIGLEVSKLNNVKFLSVISPDVTADVVFELLKIVADEATGMIKAQVVVKDDTQVFSKLSFICQPK